MGRGLSDLQRWILQQLASHGTVEHDAIYRHVLPTFTSTKDNHPVVATVTRACHRLQRRGLVHLGNHRLFPPMTAAKQQSDLREVEAAIGRYRRQLDTKSSDTDTDERLSVDFGNHGIQNHPIPRPDCETCPKVAAYIQCALDDLTENHRWVLWGNQGQQIKLALEMALALIASDDEHSPETEMGH